MSMFEDLKERVSIAALLLVSGLLCLLHPVTWSLFLIVILIWGYVETDKTIRKLANPSVKAQVVTGIAFAGFVGGLSILGLLRFVEGGAWIIVLMAVTVFVTDIVAYFFGRRFGKRKVFPVTSPNKTVEGTLAGIAAGVVIFLIVWHLLQGRIGLDPSNTWLGVMAFATPFVAVFGDWLMSKGKRLLDIKDYGKSLKEHGGVLDRFDALTITCFLTGPFWIYMIP